MQVSKRLSHISRKDTKLIIDIIFKSMSQALVGCEKIELRGFGSFKVKKRNARIGRNPKTGKKVQIPSKNVPLFKASKCLKIEF